MSTSHSMIHGGERLGAVALLALLTAGVTWSTARAEQAVDERHTADAQGLVEVFNLAGSIEVSGWDRSEVEVTGSVKNDGDRVEVTTAGSRTSIHVVPHGIGGGHGEARLTLRVPARSSLTASLVGADFKVHGVQGYVKVQTINGDISGDVGGDLKASTVSGTVHLSAPQARMVELKSISGDIHYTGGGSDVEITTVSGNATVELATLTHGRFRSVSGDFSAKLALATDARLDGESVSGNLQFEFPAEPSAEFDIQSFSGTIDSCFGPKPTESRYGPGSRLMFKNGDGRAQVHIDTKNGDVHLCAKGSRRHAALAPTAVLEPMARIAPLSENLLYVL